MSSLAPTRTSRTRTALAVQLPLSVIALAVLATGWLPSRADDITAWLVAAAADVSAAIACWHIARRLAPGHPARRFWHMVGLTAMLTAAGYAVHIAGVFGVAAPWLTATAPSLSGIGALLTVLVMLTYPLRLRSGRERLCFWLDLSTVMVSAIAYSGYFALPATGPANIDLRYLLTGPVALLIAGFAVAKLLVAGRPPFTNAAGILGAASAGAGGLTAVLWTTAAAGGYLHWITALSTSADVLLMAAGWVQYRQVDADPQALERPRRRPYSVLPYLAVAGTFALLTGALLRHGESGRILLALTSVGLCTGLVVLRQLTAFSDNARLLHELDATVHDLRTALAERDALADRLHDMAFQDGLTGLANRALLHDRLAAKLRQASPAGTVTAALLIDLDDFKPVNDRYGHAAGDAVLQQVAARLLAGVRDGDTVARIGGDEFAILVADIVPDDLSELAQRLVTSLCEPIRFADHDVQVGASVGVAVVTDPASNVDELLQAADAAMYHAKNSGKNRFAYPTASL